VKILVIGGTSFVGRHVVERALERGHDVTLFNRGRTRPDAFPDVAVVTGDRNKDLSGLAEGSWDATVDVCGYLPRQVRTLLEALGERAGHYTFVSTVSTYDDTQLAAGFSEDAPLKEPCWDDRLDWEKYGELKVACEHVARELADGRLLVIRPGYVVGPYDPTVAAGGPMVGPDEDQPLQCIDGRDLATFTVGCVERGLVDTIHVTAPDDPPTFREVLDQIATGIGRVSPQVTWIGPRDELPLSDPKEWWPAMQAGLGRARDHGLWFRPLPETAHDTLAWVRGAREAGKYSPEAKFGYATDKERALIDAAAL
jgi:2'-hydroxyisoflavone reductase